MKKSVLARQRDRSRNTLLDKVLAELMKAVKEGHRAWKEQQEVRVQSGLIDRTKKLGSERITTNIEEISGAPQTTNKQSMLYSP